MHFSLAGAVSTLNSSFPAVYQWYGETLCASGNYETVFTSAPALAYGVVLYSDSALTTLYPHSVFIYEGTVYVVNPGGGSDITIIATEFSGNARYATFDNCYGGVFSNIWIPTNSLSPGSAVYTACYADDSTKAIVQTYIIDSNRNNTSGNLIITTDGSGVISSTQACE